MADILPINTWFCFDFVSSVHRVPFNNVQLQVYIVKIKIVLYTQLSQLSHISLELLKHNIITMYCHTLYLGKKFFFSHYLKKNALLEKHHFYFSDMRRLFSLRIPFIKITMQTIDKLAGIWPGSLYICVCILI
jgi:hypothetical protein